MRKVLVVILFFVLSGVGFGSIGLEEDKYGILLSGFRGIFFSTGYFAEGVVSDVFYKHNEFLAFGCGFSGIFNIPVYGYSGFFEETSYLGNFLGYVSFLNVAFGKVRVGMLGGVSYKYLFDYRELLLFFDIFSKGEWNNWSYDGFIKKLNFGGYFTRFVPFRVGFLPFEYGFRVGYKWKDFRFLLGVLGDFDIEYLKIISALNVSFEYRVSENFRVGIGNTFRVGNFLNIEVFSSIGFSNKVKVRGYVGINYISGFIGGISFFTQI